MKLHVEYKRDWGNGLRVIETKEFDTDCYPAAIGKVMNAKNPSKINY
jgi:hypothetical protein